MSASLTRDDSTTLLGAIRGGNNATYYSDTVVRVGENRELTVQLLEDLVVQIRWQSDGPTVEVFQDAQPSSIFKPVDFLDRDELGYQLVVSDKLHGSDIRAIRLSRDRSVFELTTFNDHTTHYFVLKMPTLIGF